MVFCSGEELLSVEYVLPVTLFTVAAFLWVIQKHIDVKKEDIKNQNKVRETIPGLRARDVNLGNLPDIAEVGGYYNFLVKLHKEHGPIASFWYTQKLCVSVSTPDLYRLIAKAFDRPPEMFEIFLPLMAKECVAFANGQEGQCRRRHYDKVYTHAYTKNYFYGIHKVVGDAISEIEELQDKSHVIINNFTYKTAMKGILRECFGDYFNDDKDIINFKDNYDYCWNDIERRAGGVFPEPGSDREQEFLKRRDEIFSTMRKVIAHRRRSVCESRLFIDVAMEYGMDDERLIETDCVNMVIGGYMSTGDLMTWCLYFLAKYEDVQEKVYQEAKQILGDDPVSFDNFTSLTYTKQVFDETLRISLLGTFLIREMDTDVELAGYTVPAKTSIVSAIGVTHMDEQFWPNPTEFDPDRFNEEQKKARPRYAFVPFGFSGGRQCPGFRVTYVALTILVTSLLRRFRLHLHPNQGSPEKFRGLLTAIKGDILIQVEDRH